MIEVFKTNVLCQKEALQIVDTLEKIMTHVKINFDLEDCDKILRIEGNNTFKNKDIINFLKGLGYNCEILD
ncbi:MAG: hypothetical protein H7Y10_14980 [Flavobacterium sp.]|nr:hypothetical protein [Flavobacterium sp.]